MAAGPRGLTPVLLAASCGFRFDVGHQSRRAPLSLLLGQILPAGEGIEGQDLPGGVLETAEVFPAAASGILLGAVEPEAFQDLALGQGLDAVDPGPIPRSFDKILLEEEGTVPRRPGLKSTFLYTSRGV